MGTVSIVFRVPIRVRTKATSDLTCVRARDDRPEAEWRGCGHRHRAVKAAEKCARSMSLGQAVGAVNERVEIRRAKEDVR